MSNKAILAGCKAKAMVFCAALLLICMLSMPAAAQVVAPDSSGLSALHVVKASKKKNGWSKSDGKKYYYIKGKKVTGWRTIRGKEYFFDNSGVLQTNCITGNAQGGYDYVDQKGIRIKENTIRLAVNLVRSLTDDRMSAKQKLDTCYSYFVNHCTYASNSYTFSISNFPVLGSRLYSTGSGDCFQSALAMSYCARVLGFMCRFAEGKVDAYSSVPVDVHGWCEVKINGRYLVYDITMKRYHPTAPLGGMVTRGGYPYAIACYHTYYLHANNGMSFWKTPV